VFISGVVFLLLTLGGVRQMIVAAIPAHLFAAVAGGIGLFIGFIGLQQRRHRRLEPRDLGRWAISIKAARSSRSSGW
jgi:xanthine/uracil/vitamin C permease (AzgA family)